jgi:hypothetical protein
MLIMGARNPDSPKQTARKGKKAAPRETGCEVRMGRGASRVVRKGQAALGADELHFHTGRTGRAGKDFALHLRYDDIQEVELDVNAGTITLSVVEQEPITLVLGKYAGDWKRFILERPTPLDALGVRKRARVGVVGVADDELIAQLQSRVPVLADEAASELDMVFVGVEHRADLAQLGPQSKRVRAGGVVWAVHQEKPRAPELHEIASAGRSAGLVIGGVVEFSRTLQALRLTKI